MLRLSALAGTVPRFPLSLRGCISGLQGSVTKPPSWPSLAWPISARLGLATEANLPVPIYADDTHTGHVGHAYAVPQPVPARPKLFV